MDDTQKRTTCLAVRASLDGITELLGKNGAKIVFRSAGLLSVFENPPDYTWDPSITIPEQARIYTEISNLVGYKGALGIWRRVGYAVMKSVAEKGKMLEQFEGLPPQEKFAKALETFVLGSGKGKVVHLDGALPEFDCFDCLHCEGCDFNRPMCTHFEGFIQYLADQSFGKDAYQVKEVECKAMGGESCYFKLVKR
jgi:predicted hydrocarbon binding protein